MSLKKIIVTVIVSTICYTWASAYTEVSCWSDATFAANSCGQCFDWGNKQAWSDLWFLSDLWVNQTGDDVLLYKEEQEMPTMINLWWADSSWVKSPSDAWFWEYSDDFEALYSDTEEGYVLSDGWSVTWIKSQLGYTYSLSNNTAEEWTNIGMLVFPITTHKILSDWEITIDGDTLKECVLYKSGTPGTVVTTPPEKLPETGPAQYILLLILAMILGFSTIKILNRG